MPWWFQREAGEQPERDEETAFRLLGTELGLFDADALDYIDKRHLEGADFTRITGELNRGDFPPPVGRDRWDLGTTAVAYGIRHA